MSDTTTELPPTEPVARRMSTAGGVGWSSIGKIGSQLINMLAQLVLVPLLGTRMFGMAEIAWVTMSVLDMLADFGIGMAVVQRAQLTQRFLDTAFAINMLMAAIGSLCMVVVGFVVSQLRFEEFDGYAVAVLLWQFAPSSLTTGLVTIWRARLWRDMRFDSLSKVDLACAVVRGVVAIAMAASGCGLFSLVVGYYAAAAVGVVSLYLLVRPSLHLRIFRDEWHDLWRFGLRASGFSIIDRVLRRSDAFLLGPILGETGLGVLALARRLTVQPLEIASAVAGSVLVPRLSRLKGRVARSRVTYLRANQYLGILLVPALVMVALATPLFVEYLKPEWQPVGPVALAMLPAALIMLQLQTPFSLMIGNGRTGALLKWGLLRSLVMLAGTLTAFWFGLYGPTLVLGILLALALPALLARVRELLRTSFWNLVRDLVELLPAAAAAAALLLLARWVAAENLLPHWLAGVAGCSLGFAAYLGVLALQRPRSWRAVLTLLRRLRRRRGSR